MPYKPGWKLVQAYLDAGRTIIGVDEVGRGAWAGPVVAGAVVLKPRSRFLGLNDSKLVTAKRRRELDSLIRVRAAGWALGWVEATEVDAHGLSWAVAESGRRAIAGLTLSEAIIASEDRQSGANRYQDAELAVTDNPIVVLDGKWNYLAETHDAVAIVKADSRVTPVSAASIIAKVARDQYMAQVELEYPGYGFAQHVGYGTVGHRQALSASGPCKIHRLSYAPLRQYVHN